MAIFIPIGGIATMIGAAVGVIIYSFAKKNQENNLPKEPKSLKTYSLEIPQENQEQNLELKEAVETLTSKVPHLSLTKENSKPLQGRRLIITLPPTSTQVDTHVKTL